MYTSLISLAVCYTGHNSRVTDVCFSLHRGGGSSSKGSASRNELGSVLLTASADCSARLWRLGYTDCPIATLTHTYHQPLVKNNVSSSSQNYSISLSCGISTGPSNATARKTGKVLSGSLLDYRKGATALSGNSRNKPFGDEVKAAQFFYQDKFVVLVCIRSNIPTLLLLTLCMYRTVGSKRGCLHVHSWHRRIRSL